MGGERFLELPEITKQLLENKWVTILAGIFILLSIIYSSKSKKRQKLPPGPVGLPFLGYYPFLNKDPIKAVSDLGKKYGYIFGFNVGSQYIVFLNDAAIATKVLSKALDRPPHVFEDVPFKFGLSGANGAEWQEFRRMSFRSLKDIGLFRDTWEQGARESANNVVEQLLKQAGKPIDIRDILAGYFSSNIIQSMFGYKPLKGSAILNVVTRSIDVILGELATLRLINFSKMFHNIMEYLGIENELNLQRDLQDLENIVSNMVDQEMNNPHVDGGNSFVHQMQHEITERYEDMKERTAYIIKANIVALFTAGGETTRNTLVWTLIGLAENPDVQQKVHEELDRIVGKDGTITWAERARVPYIHATLLESMRWRTLLPHSSLRIASEDMKIEGYVIPKGTFISANVWGLHNDPEYWNDPHRFMPERFLSEDGKIVKIPSTFMPFTVGKRNCPGKQLAFMSLLQYLSVFIQNFSVAPKEGEKVQYKETLGLTYSAFNAEIRFIPRK